MATATTTQNPSSPSPEDKGEGKFDITKADVNKLPEEIREQIKGFQADYTKKTQALSEKEKENEELIKRGQQWDGWYARNKDTLAQYNEYAKKIANGENVHVSNRKPDPVIDDDDDDDDDLGLGKEKKVEKRLGAIKQDLENGKAELQKTIADGQEVLIELVEEIQTGEYPFKISPKRVIDYARKEGVGDVKKAIQGAYKDELIEHEVQTRVEAKLAEEKEKNIQVVNNSLPQGRVVRKVIKRGEGK